MSPRIPLGTDRLSELQALVQGAERGNLSAAERQLGVSPSAVSKLMTRLETRLGVQLLHRSTRKVQLTPEGWRLYEQGQRVLADLDELERSVRHRRRTARHGAHHRQQLDRPHAAGAAGAAPAG